MRFLIIIACFFALSTSLVYSQLDKANLKLASYSSLSSNELQPLWLHANQWGLFNSTGKSDVLIYGKADYTIFQKKYFSLEAGVGGVVNTNVNESFLHEAYLKGKVSIFDFSVGKVAKSLIAYDDNLTSGMYLMSSNARPIPRIDLGIFDYLPLGFTKNWVEVKGAISQGVLNQKDLSHANSAGNILLHEKFAYMRLGNMVLQPYAGLVHSALYGGTRPDGTKIPVDYWATVFAKGSAELGGGELTNAAGAHMGLWDFGFYYTSSLGKAQLYFQKPFADGSGLRLYNGLNKDYILGCLLYPKNVKWLSGISLEYSKTDFQSGYGIPDPLYPVDYKDHPQGTVIWMHDIEADYDGFMQSTFGETSTGWTEETVVRYLEDHLNEGHPYGGRDDYMNNGSYYSGWTYHNRSIGTPLYQTAETASLYAPQWHPNNYSIFVNNRIQSFNLGAEGMLYGSFTYRLKTTFTQNAGSYEEEFFDRYRWSRAVNYYFQTVKYQAYLLGELSWVPQKYSQIKLVGSVAFDFGDMYQSCGGRLSIVYQPF